MAGGRKFWRSSQIRELNLIQSGEWYPTLVSKCGVHSQTRDFCNVMPCQLKGVYNGRTMLSYIQEHIVCSWKQFESAWKSIWVLRYCKKYDVLFCFFGHLLVSQFQFLKLGHDPVKHCDEIVITGSGPSLRATAPCSLLRNQSITVLWAELSSSSQSAG